MEELLEIAEQKLENGPKMPNPDHRIANALETLGWIVLALAKEEL